MVDIDHCYFNVDWNALCAIYMNNNFATNSNNDSISPNSDKIDTIVDEQLSLLKNNLGISYNHDDYASSQLLLLKGTVCLSIKVNNTVFIETKEGKMKKRHINPLFKCTILADAPIVQVNFYYKANNNDIDSFNEDFNYDVEKYDEKGNDNDDYYENDRPVHVEVCAVHFPSKPFSSEAINALWIAWLNEKACKILQDEEGSSYTVCQFIEYEAFHFFDRVWKDEASVATHAALYASDINVPTPTTTTVVSFRQQIDSNINNNNHKNSTGTHAIGNFNSKDLAIQQSEEVWLSLQDIISSFGVQKYSNPKNCTNTGIENFTRKNYKAGTVNNKSNNSYTSSSINKYVDNPSFLLLKRIAQQHIVSNWKEWFTIACPICFDRITVMNAKEITCKHYFCLECISTYVKTIVKELEVAQKYQRHTNKNPFICPLPCCKKEIKVIQCVKTLLINNEMEIVRQWYKNVMNPLSTSLTVCPRTKQCGGKNCMRNNTNNWDETIVYCELCNVSWCELCLKKYDINNQKFQRDHKNKQCDSTEVLLFCQKYRTASSKVKRLCEEKYPWIKEYSISRLDDLETIKWIMQNNASICPVCRTGIERSEGCFHMTCCICSTHFCYECGEQIYPPYYGAHHCWEDEVRNDNDFLDHFNE